MSQKSQFCDFWLISARITDLMIWYFNKYHDPTISDQTLKFGKQHIKTVQATGVFVSVGSNQKNKIVSVKPPFNDCVHMVWMFRFIGFKQLRLDQLGNI